MTKILATTDNSPLGNQGVAHARALAQALGAQLVILAVEPDPAPIITGEFGYVAQLSPQELGIQDQEFRSSLQAHFAGDELRIERSHGRAVWQTILDTAAQVGAGLLVMTTHGRSGLGRVLLGSVAEAVVQHATIPVMLVKGEQVVSNWRE